MKHSILIGSIMATAIIGFAQTPGEPGTSPGSIVLGPGGYFQKGPDLPSRAGAPRRSRGARAGRAAAVPSVSVRPAGPTIRASAASLMGWSVGAPATAFPKLTFSEAAGRVDAAGLALIEGSSAQRVSPEIAKNLDYNLTADELAQVQHRLAELRLQMPAYRLEAFPADASSSRRLFEFAKSLGIELIISGAQPASLAEMDKLANEFSVNVALENLSPKSVAGALQGRSNRIGVVVDPSKWAQAGIKPQEGLPLVKERLMAVDLRDRSALSNTGAGGAVQFLLAISRLDPPETPAWPPKCGNCSGYRVPPSRPLFLSLGTAGSADPAADLKASVAPLETALRPAMGFRMDEIARKTPISASSMVNPVERKKIEAAVPRQALVKPLKPRKLLVLDVTPNAYYHQTTAHGTLMLELMAKYTGAYQPVFSNDLDNLKYPKIRQFDAVLINNNGGGDPFVDPDVLNGLMRFVREGGGVAGLHGSTYGSTDLPEYGEMMGAQTGAHRCCETITIKIDDPASPLTKPFAGKSFTWYDEIYHFPDTGPYSREKLHVLISIDAANTDLSEWKGVSAKNDFGLSWIRSYGKGRVFNCALGHVPELFESPAFTQHILAGIQFVLGDLKADTTPSARLAAKK